MAFDIDIDVAPNTDIAALFPSAIPASRVNDQLLVKHPCGHYFENIPVDKFTGVAAIPFKEAEQLGYTKVDFLHLSLLSQFKNKREFRRACNKEPDWSLLLKEEIVLQLFQIKNHFKIIQKVKPKSVEQLADIIALIRPDKRALLDQYLKHPVKTRPLLYRSASDDKSAFRLGHSLSYAITIVAQLNSSSISGRT